MRGCVLMLSFKVLRDSRPPFYFVKKVYIRVLVVLVDCWKLLVLKQLSDTEKQGWTLRLFSRFGLGSVRFGQFGSIISPTEINHSQFGLVRFSLCLVRFIFGSVYIWFGLYLVRLGFGSVQLAFLVRFFLVYF